MKNNRTIPFVAIIALLIASLACTRTITVNSPVQISDPAQESPAAKPLPESADQVVVPTAVYNGTTEKVVDDGYRKFRPDASWVGDDFGPEHTLPGWVRGPAIVELKPNMGFACGSVRVNEGESLYAHGGGAFWEAGSQNALIERWSHHVDEYTLHYPECSKNVYPSVAAYLTANPTYLNHE